MTADELRQAQEAYRTADYALADVERQADLVLGDLSRLPRRRVLARHRVRGEVLALAYRAAGLREAKRAASVDLVAFAMVLPDGEGR